MRNLLLLLQSLTSVFFGARVILKIQNSVPEYPEKLALEGLGVKISHHHLGRAVFDGEFS
eukprot:10859117-Ditylum_brightwellii.AAC.1